MAGLFVAVEAIGPEGESDSDFSYIRVRRGGFQAIVAGGQPTGQRPKTHRAAVARPQTDKHSRQAPAPVRDQGDLSRVA